MQNSRVSRWNRGTIPHFVRLLLMADITLVALYVLDTALGNPSWTFTRLVDLCGEANVPTWYSSGQLLVLGLLLGLFAVIKANQGAVRSWSLFAMPTVCLALSLDEVAQIHEWVAGKSDVFFATGTREGSLVPRTGIWMFLLGPPFLIIVVLLWRAFSSSVRGRERVARLYRIGFFLYMASALGIEFLANIVTPGQLASTVQLVCEELGEMLGVTVMVWATLELLASHDIHVRAGNNHAT